MTSFAYRDGNTECEGYVAMPAGAGPHPAVLIAHNWAGQSEADNAVARHLASRGYAGFAIDVYGKGKRGDMAGDNSHLMNPWMGDRAGLQKRLLAAVAAVAANPMVDAERIAIIGFCFGGLCALDVARSGATEVKGAVSFHGVYAPNGLPAKPIHAKVLVLDGWLDPLCPPEAKTALQTELEAAGADWQFLSFGGTYHAFTNKGANNPAGGAQYNATTERRAWAATEAFLAEVFAA
jgi:dienelactone hydrolase